MYTHEGLSTRNTCNAYALHLVECIYTNTRTHTKKWQGSASASASTCHTSENILHINEVMRHKHALSTSTLHNITAGIAKE
jgi:hypothetical protein